MKEILILMQNEAQDRLAAQFICSNLREVLEDTVHVALAYLEDPVPPDYAGADLILVPVYKMVYDIRDSIHDDADKVLFVSRTLSKEALRQIQAIPSGENVLVMNRSRDTTMDMLRLLYQLGVMHLNLFPYTPDTDCHNFRYVITTNKQEFPLHSGTAVINIGYRRLDTQAFLDVFSKLNLESDRLAINLTRYIQTLPKKHTDVEQRYFSTQLANKTLHTVLEKSGFGAIVTDCERKILYCNQKANNIFGTSFHQNDYFVLPEGAADVDFLFDHSFEHELIRVREEYIMVQRHDLFSGPDTMGFFFECRTASNIREMDSKLSEHLQKSGLYAHYYFHDIIAVSPEMKKCLTIAKKLAKTSYSILILGESGVGKEMIAQSIHSASDRAEGPFIAVNCAAFPENLLESELFGYEGGAFTGSRKEGRAGLFELANKGSIFLDEIVDMPMSLQAKLLRVLQEKKIMRVGSGKVIDINIRILSASNKNLKAEIEKKQFRADLYYRLSTFTIEVPPLRDRKEDIIPLFYAFTANHSRKLSDGEEEQLTGYHWPGNVRELQNATAYFNVIGNFGEFSPARDGQAVDRPLPIQDAKKKILSLLCRYPDVGLGRQRILGLLREDGVSLSEKRFESIVRELQQEKVISRGQGRAGIRLLAEPESGPDPN